MMPDTPHTFVGATTFTVTALDCTHCRRALTAEICAVPGVEAVTFDPSSGIVTVTASEPVDRADIAAVITVAGHALRP